MARAFRSVRPAGGGRKKLFIRGFIVLYLVVQISLPVVGLRARGIDSEMYPFSWHMFSGISEMASE